LPAEVRFDQSKLSNKGGRATRRIAVLVAIALAGFLLLGACSTENQSGGGGSDVPNSLEGTIISGTGPVPGARIELHRADWTPITHDTALVVRADESGRFRITIPSDGNWKLHATDSNRSLAAQMDIAASATLPPLVLRLEPSATLSGVLGDSLDVAEGFHVFVLGLNLVSELDTNGNWRIDALPSGQQRLVAVSNNDPTISYPLGDVVVRPGDSAVAIPATIGPELDTSRLVVGQLWYPIGKRAKNGFVVLKSLIDTDSIRCAVDDSGRFSLMLPTGGLWLFEARSQTRTFLDTLHPEDLEIPNRSKTRAALERIDLLYTGTVYGSILPGIGWLSSGGSTAGWVARIPGITRSEVTGIAGHFRIRSVPVGDWTLMLSHPDGRSIAFPQFSVRADVVNELPLRIVRSSIDTTAESEFVVGRIWIGEAPLPKAWIESFPLDSTDTVHRMQGQADDSGRFAIQSDPSRLYQLRIIDPQTRQILASLPWGAGSDPDSIASIQIRR